MRSKIDETSALSAFRVLDLTDDRGAYCTKVLADLGADVVKVEPPEGDPTRRLGPFKDDIPNPETSLTFIYYNTNKRSTTLNLSCADGKAIFRKLVAAADVVVESFRPGYMDSLCFGYQSLKEVNPAIVMASITGFGQSGPFKDYKAPEIVSIAMAGPMYLSGVPERPPLMAPGPLAYMTASTYAAVGILLALYGRARTGKGQWVEVSAQECTMTHADFTLQEYLQEGVVPQRRGSSHVEGGPRSLHPCKDGHVLLQLARPIFLQKFFEWMGKPEILNDPNWKPTEFRQANPEVIDKHTTEFTKQFTKEEFYLQGQSLNIPVTPVTDNVIDFINDPQTGFHGYFSEITHPEIGRYRHPGVPYTLSKTPYRLQRPAPRLGEHNLDIYCDELGLSKQELVTLRQIGAI